VPKLYFVKKHKLAIAIVDFSSNSVKESDIGQTWNAPLLAAWISALRCATPSINLLLARECGRPPKALSVNGKAHNSIVKKGDTIAPPIKQIATARHLRWVPTSSHMKESLKPRWIIELSGTE
jgi:hypothetical protein